MSGFSAVALDWHLLPQTSTSALPAQREHLSLPSPAQLCQQACPGLDPGAGEASPTPGHCSLSSRLSQIHCQTDTAFRLLIAIRSRRSSPQDRNAIFSLNYVKSFREGGEII